MNIVADVFDSSLIERLGWVLLHSIWQIALVAAVFTIAIRFMAHSSANARYGVGCMALLLMIAAPSITFFLGTTPIHDESVVHVGETGSESTDSHDSAGTTVGNPTWEKPESAIAAIRVSPTVGPSDDARMSEKVSPLAEEVKPVEPSRPSAQPISFVQRTRSVLPLVVACWLAGVIILMLRPALGLFATQRMRRVGVQPVSKSVIRLTNRLGRQIGLKRSVQVVRSTVVSVPAAIGILRPMILLPVSIVSGLTPDQLASVIAHELAHIRRHDFLVNALQTVVESILFFHPLAWWVSQRVRQEREYCCDDKAVLACGSLANYAQALLIVDQLRGESPQFALSAAGGSIRHRIRRLMGKPIPTDTSRGLCLAGLLLLSVGLSYVLADRVESQLIAAEESNKKSRLHDKEEEQTPATKKTAASKAEDKLGYGTVLDGLAAEEYELSFDTLTLRTAAPSGERLYWLQINKNGSYHFDVKSDERLAQYRLDSRAMKELDKLVKSLPGSEVALEFDPKPVVRNRYEMVILRGKGAHIYSGGDLYNKAFEPTRQFLKRINAQEQMYHDLTVAGGNWAAALMRLNLQLDAALGRRETPKPSALPLDFNRFRERLEELSGSDDKRVRNRAERAVRTMKQLAEHNAAEPPKGAALPKAGAAVRVAKFESFTAKPRLPENDYVSHQLTIAPDGSYTYELYYGPIDAYRRTGRLAPETLAKLDQYLAATGYLSNADGNAELETRNRGNCDVSVSYKSERRSLLLYQWNPNGVYEKLVRLVGEIANVEYGRTTTIPWERYTKKRYDEAVAKGQPVLTYFYCDVIAHVIETGGEPGPPLAETIQLLKKHDVVCLNGVHQRGEPLRSTDPKSPDYIDPGWDGLSLYLPSTAQTVSIMDIGQKRAHAALMRAFNEQPDGLIDIGGEDFTIFPTTQTTRIGDFEFRIYTESDWVLPEKAGEKWRLPIKYSVRNATGKDCYFPHRGTVSPSLETPDGKKYELAAKWQGLSPNDTLYKAGRGSGGIYIDAYFEKDQESGEIRFHYFGQEGTAGVGPITPGEYRLRLNLRPCPYMSEQRKDMKPDNLWSGRGTTAAVPITVHSFSRVTRSRKQD